MTSMVSPFIHCFVDEPVARLSTQAEAVTGHPELLNKVVKTFNDLTNSKSSFVLIASVADLNQVAYVRQQLSIISIISSSVSYLIASTQNT